MQDNELLMRLEILEHQMLTLTNMLTSESQEELLQEINQIKKKYSNDTQNVGFTQEHNSTNLTKQGWFDPSFYKGLEFNSDFADSLRYAVPKVYLPVSPGELKFNEEMADATQELVKETVNIIDKGLTADLQAFGQSVAKVSKDDYTGEVKFERVEPFDFRDMGITYNKICQTVTQEHINSNKLILSADSAKSGQVLSTQNGTVNCVNAHKGLQLDQQSSPPTDADIEEFERLLRESLNGITPEEMLHGCGSCSDCDGKECPKSASKDVSTKEACVHEWKAYVGLTESYEYCKKCDEKKK